VEKSGDISLSLYDLGGRQIKTIVHTDLEKGEHNYSTNIGYLPSGTYVVVLKKDNGNQFNKVIRK
jgi:dihydroxyacetone kinase DhaKLM complex PTS-EIIA-like component DhaM